MIETKALIHSKIIAEKFLKTFFICDKKNVLLIGYFIDNEDSGVIFIDHEMKKIYSPINQPIYFSFLEEYDTLGYIEDELNKKFVGINKKNQATFLSNIKNEKELYLLHSLLKNDEIINMKSPIFEDFRKIK